jgi:hypothetical protein
LLLVIPLKTEKISQSQLTMADEEQRFVLPSPNRTLPSRPSGPITTPKALQAAQQVGQAIELEQIWETQKLIQLAKQTDHHLIAEVFDTKNATKS